MLDNVSLLVNEPNLNSSLDSTIKQVEYKYNDVFQNKINESRF